MRCCHADIINYGSLPYTDFIRTKTLCQGGNICDFRFVRHETDAGCGGGRNAAKLLEKYPEAKLTALDYSPVSVEKTRELNHDAVTADRCAVVEGSVAKLDFEDGRFDLVTAFETVYFWPELTDCFTEVCRVLKPGRTFLIVNEADGEDAASRKWEEIIDGMRCYTEQQLVGALKAAGFSEVRAARHADKPWLSLLATK